MIAPSQLNQSSRPAEADKSTIYSKESAGGLSCPSCATYHRMLEETIDVLIKTKSAFRSKTLATLRRQIETLLKSTAETAPHQ